MTKARRADLTDCLLDLLDFIAEKIGEAVERPESQCAAISEAAGAIPVLVDRLREDEVT